MKQIIYSQRKNPPRSRLVARLPLLLIFAISGFGGWKLWVHGTKNADFVIRAESAVTSHDLAPEARAEFSQLNHYPVGKNLLSANLTADLRQTYQNCIWVKEVRQIKRVFPNQILIELVPRRPYLQVAFAQQNWLVDDQNTLLAAGKKNRPLLPLVTGDIENRPPCGKKWNDIAPAYRTLAVLENSPLANRLPVREIKINRPIYYDKERARHHSRPRMEITTHDNIHILWGAEPLGEPNEISDADKIRMLESLLRHPPRNRQQISLDVRTTVAGYTLRMPQP